MYNNEQVTDKIFGATPLVGWRQENDPERSTVNDELTTSRSGRYFQSAHPLLTLSNIFSIAPKFGDYSYPSWDVAVTYGIGEKVKTGDPSKNYISRVEANTGNDPVTETLQWKEWTIQDQRSEWLSNKTRDYISGVVDDFIEQKHWDKLGKSIIEDRAIFDGTQYQGETIPNESKVVGFEIKTALNMGIVAKLGRIGLEFSEAGDIPIKIYHSSQKDPVHDQTFTIDNAYSMQWFDLDFLLPYLSEFDAGGSWRLEYDQNEINGEAINKAKNWGTNVGYMNGYEYSSWKLWSEFVQFHPYSVPVDQRDDPRERLYEYTTNYGMNLIVSVYCDYTELFVRQESVFINAIIKGVGASMLREIAYNSSARVNLNEGNMNTSKDEILYELEGNSDNNNNGLLKKYTQALEAVKISTQGLSKYCLPCGRKGIKIKTI